MQNSVTIPAASPITVVTASIDLPEGTVISGISVRVIDNTGTTLQASWGDSTGAVLGVSPVSAGNSTLQNLPITVVPQAIAPNVSYWVSVAVTAGTNGWTVLQAHLT